MIVIEVLKRILIGAALVMMALGAAAEPYTIEQIVIEGTARVSERILWSEARVELGESYSEADLRQSVHRLRRLPFVFAADYRVEPAADGRGYVLVYTVIDEQRFSYRIEASGTATESDEDGAAHGGVGARLFTSNGVLETTLGSFQPFGDSGIGDFGLGYRMYDLFGTGASVRLGVQKEFAISDSSDWRPVLELELPLTLRQSIRMEATRFSATREFRPAPDEKLGLDSSTTLALLSWVYDTTDDPLFTTSGLRLTAGPTYLRGRAEVPAGVLPSGSTVVSERETEQVGLLLDARRYWPLGERQSVVAGLSASASDSETSTPGVSERSSDSRSGVIDLGYVRNFGAALDSAGQFRSRLELGGGWEYFESDSQGRSFDSDVPFVSVGGSIRHPWGRVSLTGRYLFD